MVFTVVYVPCNTLDIECLGIFSTYEEAEEYMRKDLELAKETIVENGGVSSVEELEDMEMIEDSGHQVILSDYGSWTVCSIVELKNDE